MKQKIDFRRILSGFIILSRLVLGLCMFPVYTGLAPDSLNGFGVDSAGRLYLGLGHRIEVWENGQQVKTIRKGTSRGYMITIQADDTILIASGVHVMVIDLEGTTVLESYEEDAEETWDTLVKQQHRFTDVHGETYTAGRLRGRITILHGKTVIYQEPLWACICTWLWRISLPCVIASFIIEYVMKREDDYPKSRFTFDPRSR